MQSSRDSRVQGLRMLTQQLFPLPLLFTPTHLAAAPGPAPPVPASHGARTVPGEWVRASGVPETAAPDRRAICALVLQTPNPSRAAFPFLGVGRVGVGDPKGFPGSVWPRGDAALYSVVTRTANPAPSGRNTRPGKLGRLGNRAGAAHRARARQAVSFAKRGRGNRHGGQRITQQTAACVAFPAPKCVSSSGLPSGMGGSRNLSFWLHA